MRLVPPKPQARAELSIPIRGDGLVPPKRPKGAKADASAVELARGEVGGVPEIEPAVGGGGGFSRKGGFHGLGAKANTKGKARDVGWFRVPLPVTPGSGWEGPVH